MLLSYRPRIASEAFVPRSYGDADDGDDDLGVADDQPAEGGLVRDRKRQRRSIFRADYDDATDDDDAHEDDQPQTAADGQVVPATPYAASPLCSGACLLSPGLPRRASSPCLRSASAFVALHEEPNAGFRSYMEDRSSHMTVDGVAYLGVFDGHGGIDASCFLQRHLLRTIQAHMLPGSDIHDALATAYSATNAAFRATGSIQGSTATTCIIKDRRLIAANVGDSPAFVVKRSGEVYNLIQEHKIEGEEAARIAAHGAPIYRSPTGPAYMGTPDGTRWLNMSRAFGDFVYPAISCEPHVCSLDLSDGKYLVIGSDGLTEKWPVAEAAQYVTQLAGSGWSLPAICRSLVERSLARGSTDNISCMIVDLEAYLAQVEEAEAAECGAAKAESIAQEGLGQVLQPSAAGDACVQQAEAQSPAPGESWQRLAQEDGFFGSATGVHLMVCAETPVHEQELELAGLAQDFAQVPEASGVDSTAAALAFAADGSAAPLGGCSALGSARGEAGLEALEGVVAVLDDAVPVGNPSSGGAAKEDSEK